MPATRSSGAALTKFEEAFAKRFGEGSIRTPRKRKYQTVSTGSLTLDYAMGCGGWIVGRVSEIWGPESCGKSTLSIIGLANFQQAFPKRLVGIIDMERTFDEAWAEANGLNLRMARVLRPHSAEDVSDMSRDLIVSGHFSAVVLDSVGGMVTEEEMKKDAEQSAMGTAAQVTTRMVKQAAVLCDDNATTLLIVNQVRANLGYGADTQSSGAWALKHVTTHKIKVRRTATEPFTIGGKETRETVGFEIAALVEKNKVAPPRRTAIFALMNQSTEQYGPIGVDRATEAFVMGKRLGIIDTQPGGYYALPGLDERVRGQEKVLDLLRTEQSLLTRIRTEMLDRVRDVVADEVPEQDPTPAAVDGTEEEPEVIFGGTPLDVDPDVALLDELRRQRDEVR